MRISLINNVGGNKHAVIALGYFDQVINENGTYLAYEASKSLKILNLHQCVDLTDVPNHNFNVCYVSTVNHRKEYTTKRNRPETEVN